MTKYSILPNVPLDPRSEIDLIIESAKRVYEASNGRLNDFSAGSPTMALLEGQAYAGAELLNYLNNLPEAILMEWLGPLLGIQRRLGTPSKATLRVEIVPHGSPWVLREGFLVRTNTAITGRESQAFTTDRDLIIAPMQSIGEVPITSIEVGSDQNLEIGIITEFNENLSFLRAVSNITPATGGTDEESLLDVKERAFSLIRRRNPVSGKDWEEYIESLIGSGSIVLVKNRRPEVERQDTDALYNSSHVSFFLLGPGGQRLSNAELAGVKEKVTSHLPVNTQGHVYNLDRQMVDFWLRVSYNPSTRGGNLEQFTREIYDSLMENLSPNVVFPIGEDIQLQDLTTMFAHDFAYLSPNLESLRAYSIPKGFSVLDPLWKKWETGKIYQTNELIKSQGRYYQVLQSFDPIGLDPKDAVNEGLLQFNRVKGWLEFPHRVNDVVFNDQTGGYHIILYSVTGEDPIIGNAITSGKVSPPITPIHWVSNESLSQGMLVYSVDGNNDIIPNEVYLVKEAFTVLDKGSIESAELSGVISEVYPEALTQDESYTTGNYVYIANRFAGVDYYIVLQDFTYTSISSPLQETYKGNILPIVLHTTTPSTFRGRRYKSRFKVGEYVSYKDTIYQVGKDFTPNGDNIRQMVSDRRLYLTEFELNPTLGVISSFEALNLPVEIEFKETVYQGPNIDETVTNGSGDSLVLRLDFQRGNFFEGGTEFSNLNIINGGSGYAVNDLVTIPAKLSSYHELDGPVYCKVSSIGVGGVVTELVPTTYQETLRSYLRRVTFGTTVNNLASDAVGEGAAFNYTVVRPEFSSFRGFATEITLGNGGDKYRVNELLEFIVNNDYITRLSDKVQVRVLSIVGNLPFSYSKLYRFTKGDYLKYQGKAYEANKDFTAVIPGVDYYVSEGTINPISIPSKDWLEQLDDLFEPSQSVAIPSPLVSLPGVVFFDNRASIYNTATKAFDGLNTTFWQSLEVGDNTVNTSYIGVDLGTRTYVETIEFTHLTSIDPSSPSSVNFEVQYSERGINGPWFFAGTGTNTESVQSIKVDKSARYWRFTPITTGQLGAVTPWKVANIRFIGDSSYDPLPKEDFIIYEGNISTSIYRVLSTFTPDVNVTPREYELQGKLLKVVREYKNEDYILNRADYSSFSVGNMSIELSPHGFPDQISRYVIEEKDGDRYIYSHTPGDNVNDIISYSGGTFSL